MSDSRAPGRSYAFVLLSYRPDEPTGSARAIAAFSAGLPALGRGAFVITAAPQPEPDPHVATLTALPAIFPADHHSLRRVLRGNRQALGREIDAILASRAADVVIYMGALLGLGCLATSVTHSARRVLAVDDDGNYHDVKAALAGVERVMTSSAAVCAQARRRGFDTTGWHIVPPPLLVDPGDVSVADAAERERLRLHGPIRLAARLSTDQGITSLLRTAPASGRALQLALAPEYLEDAAGGQHALLECCRALAWQVGAEILPPVAWRHVPAFLAGAAVTVIPSRRPIAGTIALESLSAGTPVVTYRTGDLADLIGETAGNSAGVLVRPAAGPAELWYATRQLLDDPGRYQEASVAARRHSLSYRAHDPIAAFLDATSP